MEEEKDLIKPNSIVLPKLIFKQSIRKYKRLLHPSDESIKLTDEQIAAMLLIFRDTVLEVEGRN